MSFMLQYTNVSESEVGRIIARMMKSGYKADEITTTTKGNGKYNITAITNRKEV